MTAPHNGQLDAALALAAKGIPVFPCWNTPENEETHKAPHIAGGFHSASRDPVQIKTWWRKWPNALIGMPTGPASGIDVLDLDKKHGKNGFAFVPDWEQRSTVIARTVNGAHLYFKSEGTITSTSDQIASGVDTRGVGGYVIVPPSPGYTWVNGHDLSKLPPWPDDLRPPEKKKRNSRKFGSNYPPADIMEIKAALAVTPSDSEIVWFEVGCALAFELGDGGLPLYVEWSVKTPDKFIAEQCLKKWEHCKTITTFTAGTIFHHATEADPEWRKRYEANKTKQSSCEPPNPSVSATPFEWIDPSKIPQREWQYPPNYIRAFCSATFAHGGVGKSSVTFAEAVAMVTGKSLLGVKPEKALRVWYWNGEDPADELQRRIAATIKHYGITKDDMGDRLFVDSGRTMPIVIAEDSKSGTKISVPDVTAVIETLKENKIDVFIIDPFVSVHRVAENDNTGIEKVVKSFSHIAEAAHCSVMLVHHSRKTNGNEVTTEDGRGASALLAAVRAARALNKMTKADAQSLRIDEGERQRYIRSDNGKASMMPPADKATWYRIDSVELGNGPGGVFGDNVGVATAWEATAVVKMKDDVATIRRAQEAIGRGGPWRESSQAKAEPWVGIAIAEACLVKADLYEPGTKKFLCGIITAWIRAGWLKRVERPDPRRALKIYIEAGNIPSAPPAGG